MSLTKYEMETIINFNEEEQTAEIYTYNKSMKRKLEKYSKEKPNECKMVKIGNNDDSVKYSVPKKWIKIYPPRKTKSLTEEEKRKRIANLTKNSQMYVVK